MMIYDDVKFVDSKKKLVSIKTNNKRTKGQTTSITENYLKKHIQHSMYTFIYRLSVISLIVLVSRLLAFAHFVL
jgi:hypothetical protein